MQCLDNNIITVSEWRLDRRSICNIIISTYMRDCFIIIIIIIVFTAIINNYYYHYRNVSYINYMR